MKLHAQLLKNISRIRGKHGDPISTLRAENAVALMALLALDQGKPCKSPMSRQILDAQKGGLRILWCESKGYGDARVVWCQSNRRFWRTKNSRRRRKAELEVLKQRAEGEEEGRIFRSRLGHWHDGGSEEGAKTKRRTVWFSRKISSEISGGNTLA
jgi:hypothetical protein